MIMEYLGNTVLLNVPEDCKLQLTPNPISLKLTN